MFETLLFLPTVLTSELLPPVSASHCHCAALIAEYSGHWERFAFSANEVEDNVDEDEQMNPNLDYDL